MKTRMCTFVFIRVGICSCMPMYAYVCLCMPLCMPMCLCVYYEDSYVFIRVSICSYVVELVCMRVNGWMKHACVCVDLHGKTHQVTWHLKTKVVHAGIQ